ncbi:hypothetical protein C7212DRAFT_158222, partial [Tuber magnatum]
KYWWRNQSAAFVLGWKEETMGGLRELRFGSKLHHGISLNRDSTGTPLTRKLSVASTMPPGAFAMHVQH